MASLIVVIMTNGTVTSTYTDGSPADRFTGKLPILKDIFFHLENKEILSRNEKITDIKFYISNDPLHTKVLEVTSSYLKHILQYVRVDELESIPINQQQDIDVNKLIEDTNKLSENKDFDKKDFDKKRMDGLVEQVMQGNPTNIPLIDGAVPSTLL